MAMYLSKLELNPHFPKIYAEIGNAYKLHQRIMEAFPNQENYSPNSNSTARSQWQILFRHGPDSMTILVQSGIAPDWQKLPPNYPDAENVRCSDSRTTSAVPPQS